MNKHFLQLNAYAFPLVNIRANGDVDTDLLDSGAISQATAEADVDANVQVSVAKKGSDEGDKDFSITMKILGVTHDTVVLPYQIELEVYGLFTLDAEKAKDEDLWNRILQNAAAILYSSSRDFVMTVTSRGPWGGMMLPTIAPKLEMATEESTEKVAKSLPTT